MILATRTARHHWLLHDQKIPGRARVQVVSSSLVEMRWHPPLLEGKGQLKCDGTRAETRFRLSAKRTGPFKSAGGRQFSRLLAPELCASAVVMLDTACSEVV